jgi:hypothetical protein
MNAVIQISVEDEVRALGVLLRHSPGTILPNRTYVIDDAAARAFRDAGVAFREIAGLPLTTSGKAVV